MSDTKQGEPREACIVSYYDALEHLRKVERWPTYEQARERYYTLINAAFARMVRLGQAELVNPRTSSGTREGWICTECGRPVAFLLPCTCGARTARPAHRPGTCRRGSSRPTLELGFSHATS